jgi:hypothetical protein
MLEIYPTFEQKLKQRRKTIKPPKTPKNTDVEISVIDKSAYERYERLLKQYEEEQ